jgi:hypothetical protein
VDDPDYQRDAQGSAVPPRSGELLTQEIPVVLPGQRIGAGSWTYVRDGSSGQPVKVSGFQVELGTAQWLAQPGATEAFTEISTKHLSTDRSTVEQETGDVKYSMDSRYCRALAPRGVATVFRDPTGKVDGGSFDPDKSRLRCPPDTSTWSVSVFRSIPSGIDDSKTQSYPYCDIAPAGRGITPSGAPIN